MVWYDFSKPQLATLRTVSCFRLIVNLLSWFKRHIKLALFGTYGEPKKSKNFQSTHRSMLHIANGLLCDLEVITRSRWRAARKCLLFHSLPLATTVTLSYFNLKMYFIGATLSGLSTPEAQDIDRLVLQVTAKIVVRPSYTFLHRSSSPLHRHNDI
jgi:hypothetical protein